MSKYIQSEIQKSSNNAYDVENDHESTEYDYYNDSLEDFYEFSSLDYFAQNQKTRFTHNTSEKDSKIKQLRKKLHTITESDEQSFPGDPPSIKAAENAFEVLNHLDSLGIYPDLLSVSNEGSILFEFLIESEDIFVLIECAVNGELFFLK